MLFIFDHVSKFHYTLSIFEGSECDGNVVHSLKFIVLWNNMSNLNDCSWFNCLVLPTCNVDSSMIRTYSKGEHWIDSTYVDIQQPMLVYVFKEKRLGYDHNKEGTVNALVLSFPMGLSS